MPQRRRSITSTTPSLALDRYQRLLDLLGIQPLTQPSTDRQRLFVRCSRQVVWLTPQGMQVPKEVMRFGFGVGEGHSAGEGERAVQPLRAFGPPAADLLGAMPYTALQSLFDASAPHGALSYAKSDFLNELSDECIDILVHHAATMPQLSPLATVHIYPVGGAIQRVGREETAYAHRDARFVTMLMGTWFDPAQSEAHIQWVRDLWQAMRPFATGGVYVNFLGEEGEERVKAAYGDQYQRLLSVKQRYDPTNFFHLNQNVSA